MKLIKKFIMRYKNLRTRDKIMSVAALIMTIAFVVSVPSIAWFAQQKSIATMAKIDSPAKLSLRSGAGEDIVRFKMSGIDTESGHTDTASGKSYKDFVFCVEGEDITRYSIQLAHTTNINFSYQIYKAKTSPTGGVEYVDENRNSVFYQPAESALAGTYINRDTETYTVNGDEVTRDIGTRNYEEPSYFNDDENNGANADARQKYAEPLYWQTQDPITANDENYDEDSAARSFRNFYVLRVLWGPDVQNDKETDLIYITAQVVSN